MANVISVNHNFFSCYLSESAVSFRFFSKYPSYKKENSYPTSKYAINLLFRQPYIS